MPENKPPEIKTEVIEPAQNPKKEVAKQPEPAVAIKEPLPEMDFKLSHEERILAFLRKQNADRFTSMNDFLKSLYPLPKEKAPIPWQQQPNMKKLRHTLVNMAQSGKIEIFHPRYKQLGMVHYPDTTGVTHYYHLGDITIEAKIL